VATISSLVDKVRVELGDLGKSFVMQFMADGTTNRFRLHYAPLDGSGVTVIADGVDVSNNASVEESTGVLVLDTLPADGVEITVSGTYYRYFTATELSNLVTSAVDQHSAHHTDSLGRQVTVATLPIIEEYPVAVYATTLALYTLATDAAFDIDIQAPDGVTIPRAERYRQLMEMIQARQIQYKDLCVHLGIGMYKIDIFNLRRVSKTTNRYVPSYKPQEVDDRSYPQRVQAGLPTYGDDPTEWATEERELTAYQGVAFSKTITFNGPVSSSGISFVAKLLNQRGSTLSYSSVVQNMTLSITNNVGVYTATMSLTAAQTKGIARRTYWQIASINDTTNELIQLIGGNFFTERVSEVVL
jgi:hypothetical protein